MTLYIVCYTGAGNSIVFDQQFSTEHDARTYAYRRQQENDHMRFLILKACSVPT